MAAGFLDGCSPAPGAKREENLDKVCSAGPAHHVLPVAPVPDQYLPTDDVSRNFEVS